MGFRVQWHIPTPKSHKLSTLGPSTSLLKGNLAKIIVIMIVIIIFNNLYSYSSWVGVDIL